MAKAGILFTLGLLRRCAPRNDNILDGSKGVASALLASQ